MTSDSQSDDLFDAGHGWTHELFAGIGRFSVRFKYLVVVGWIAITFAAIAAFPSLASVANNNNSAFLPKNTPSLHAAALGAPFERGTLPSSVLVAVRTGAPLTAADQAAMTRLEAAIGKVKDIDLVRDQGVSGDGKARKALVIVGARGFGSGSTQLVDTIRSKFSQVGAPAGLAFHLGGELASSVDNQRASDSTLRNTQKFAVLFILLLLLVVFRSLLAPLVTLLPAGLALLLAGPIIAESSKAGVQVSEITQIMLSVLVLGAGTDYGLFLVFRVREEMRRGLSSNDAVVKSLSRVGESITFSAATVIAALLCLLVATFGFYQGLGPALAIGVFVMLLVGLTLQPALLAIFGRVAFWPSNVKPGVTRIGLWGRIAGAVVRRPLITVVLGILVFGGLSVASLGYAPAGFTSNGSTSTTSDSAQANAVLIAHYPAAQSNPTNILFRLPRPVWSDPSVLARVRDGLLSASVFKAVSGPLNPNGVPLTPQQIVRLHARLGPATRLPPVPRGTSVSTKLYNAYRATAQFISPDGLTLQYYTTLQAGAPDSTSAMKAVPDIRTAVTAVAQRVGATDNGVAGEASAAYDISSISGSDLLHIVPLVLFCIAVLLGLVLRSVIAPLYLIVSVGLSYLAALGVAVIAFMGFGGDNGLTFILPFFLFIFVMALGEDYNILVMSRIREEAHNHTLMEAVTQAVNATGGTVTSAGLVLAGTFGVLTFAGTGQVQQLGFTIAFGILMDTFLVRTLLLPSAVVLLGRWNWWPFGLAADPTATSSDQLARAAGD